MARPIRYYLYKLYFSNGATYIGLHREKSPNDGYITSSSYYNKHKDLFVKKDIILECKDNETLEIMETIAILGDKATNPHNVNYNLGAWADFTKFDRGFSGPANGMYGKHLKDLMSPEAYQKWREKQDYANKHRKPTKGKKEFWYETRAKHQAYLQKIRDVNKQIKKIQKEIQAKKMAERKLKKYFWQYNPNTLQETYWCELRDGWVKGRLPHNLWSSTKKEHYKKVHSINVYESLNEERKKVRNDKLREKQTGKRSITNGVTNRWIRIGEDMPVGFYYGFTKTDYAEKARQNQIGRKMYNNGVRNIWVRKGEPVPEGFVLGKILEKGIWGK